MKSEKATRFGLIACLVFYFATTLYFCFESPRLPVNEGWGWDGAIFGWCATDLPGCIQSHRVGEFHMHRLLPSVPIAGYFAAFNSNPSPAEVVLAFSIQNYLCLLLSFFLWVLICRRRRFPFHVLAFGACCIFFNNAFFTQAFYSPINTDYPAFLFAMFLLWISQQGLMASRLGTLLLLPSAFTWQTIPPFLTALSSLVPRSRNRFDLKVNPIFLKTFPILTCLIYLACSIYFLPGAIQTPSGEGRFLLNWIPLSELLVLIYVFRVARMEPLIRFVQRVQLDWVAVGILAVSFGLLFWIDGLLRPFAWAEAPTNNSFAVFIRVVTETMLYPGHFIVAAVVLYGPWILILAKEFPKILAVAAEKFLPLFPILVVGAIFFTLTESRYLTFFLPFLVYVLCDILKDRLSESWIVLFCVISILLSKFWQPLASGPFGQGSQGLDFPAQLLFMNIGPWMSVTSYLIGVGQVVGSLSFVWLVLKKNRRTD